MYLLNRDDLPLGEFDTKQHQHEQKQFRVRVVEQRGSDNGVTVGIGRRKGAFFKTLYAFYNKPQKKTEADSKSLGRPFFLRDTKKAVIKKVFVLLRDTKSSF